MSELRMTGADLAAAPRDVAEKAHRELRSECGFEYDLARAKLLWRELGFYPAGTWLCCLELAPQQVRMRGSKRTLTAPTNIYFVFRPSDQSMPIMPLGNDTDWVLRANAYYGLTLGKQGTTEDDLNLAEIVEAEDPNVLHRIIDYLHFYYNFTRYDGYIGGPVRFRVPRTIADLEFLPNSDQERSQVLGALWRFLDARGTGQVQPAVGTVIRFINRYHADVPIQIGSSLWRLRISLRLRNGYVRLYGQVPFFHSPSLVAPTTTEIRVLPAPRRLFYREPWLLIPARVRAAIGALVYFTAATSWLVAASVALGFSLTFVFHPLLVDQVKNVLAWFVPFGWGALWLCAAYAISVFGLVVAFVFQFDGVLKRAARTAPGPLRGAYVAFEKLQRTVWDWFRPRLQSPLRKTGTAALWLVVSSIFLILSFTALQVAAEPLRYAGDEAGQRVLRTFFGHATIAFPGVPYVLGAFNLDPLEWLKDPNMRSAMVLGFRVMMLLVVYRAFWKLLGYASPRILARDSRRLEHELSKLRRTAGRRRLTGRGPGGAASAAVP